MAKASRAAFKRLAEQKKAEASAPKPVNPDQAEYLDRYTPEGIAPLTWSAIRGTHREVMLAAQIKGDESFKKRSRELAGYLARRYEAGRSISIADAMTHQAIDEDVATHPGTSERSRNDRRSRLRKVAEAVNPGLTAMPRATPGGHVAVKPPYSLTEELAIKRIALRQRNPVARRNLCIVVGLCGGAGLDSPDLRHLHGAHVLDHLDGGIQVDVPGRRARTVWVRRDYEQLVRIGLQGIGADDLVLGQLATRRNIAGAVVQRAEILEDIAHIEASRLRTTWLAWLMTRPVPLNVILDAAGLSSARTLIDILPHLPSIPAGDDTLRGEGTP